MTDAIGFVENALVPRIDIKKKIDQTGIPVTSSSQIFHLPEPPEHKATDYLNAYTNWVYSAVNLIATQVAGVSLHLHQIRRTSAGREITEVPDHEAISLLGEVNPFTTFYDHVMLTQIYLELMGEAYWVILRDKSGKPAQLWNLRPDWVSIKPSKTEFIEEYIYGQSMGMQVNIPVGDVIAFKTPNPLNIYRGKGAVQAGASAIDIDQFSDDWNRNFFFNSAMPLMVLSKKQGELSKETLDRFRAEFENKFQGRANAHKVAILTGDWQVDKLSQTSQELDFINTKNYIRDEILSLFHVSKSNLGIVEDVNRASASASDARFQETVIRPRMIRLVTYLNEFYLREWKDEELFFDFDNPVPKNTELDLLVYQNGLANGWLTINEVRARENLTPATGGDRIFLPFNLTPVGSVSETVRGFFGKKTDKEEGVIILEVGEDKKKKFMIPVPARRLAKLRTENLQKEISQDFLKLANLIVRDVKGKKQKVKMQSASLSKEAKEAFWRAMVAKTDVQEQKMQDILREFFEAQKANVLRELEEGKSLPNHEIKALFPNLTAEAKKLWNDLFPFVRALIVDKSDEIFDFLGVRGELDLSQERVQEYLSDRGLNLAKGINETTKEAIKDTLKAGVAEGEGIAKLKKRIESVYNDAEGFRSEMIARTEVLGATNFATLETYEQSDVVEGKQWLAELDEETSEDCQDLDGEVVSLREDFPFTSEGGAVNTPPLHPNCRCTIIPVFNTGERASVPDKLKTIEVSIDRFTKKLEEQQSREKSSISAEITTAQDELKRIREARANEQAEAEKKLKETEAATQSKVGEAEAESKKVAAELIETAKAEAKQIVGKAEEEKKGILENLRQLRDRVKRTLNGE